MLHRLPCGIILTDAFIVWLQAWKGREAAAHFGLIPELNYVRCREGERSGQSWLSLIWSPLDAVKAHEIFDIGGVRVFIPRQSRIALRERCVDLKDGAPVVI